MSNGTVLDWAQVDVFAERALEGNMLAIFPDAGGLSDAQMQALARETNLSETTFVLPGDAAGESERGIRVRIFTPEEELPFAGHPTLGTASWLRLNRPELADAETVTLHLNAGSIPVRFASQDPARHGVDATMRQLDPEFDAEPAAGPLLAALGLAESDLHDALRPQTVSTGLPFTIVPLRDVPTLERLRVSADAVAVALRGTGSSMAYCIAPTGVAPQEQAEDPAQWRARMRFYAGEDPATGSAAGCAISYLVRHGAAVSGERVILAQGVEMRRPSRIIVSAVLDGDRVRCVDVGGRTIPVAMGRFILR